VIKSKEKLEEAKAVSGMASCFFTTTILLEEFKFE
jgi:hypothetical protein